MGVDARMFVRIKGRENWLDPNKELETAVALTRVVGAGHFIITKKFDGWKFGKPNHALSILEPLSREEAEKREAPEMADKVVYFQDGDPIVAADDEQFIVVHLASCYYGPEYARGDWPTIRTVAEWLEIRFPKGEVWYGGDSSGICANLLDRIRRDDINRYYLTKGHSDYRRGYSPFEAGNANPTCRCCEQSMMSCGGGQGSTFWFCDGCDGKAISRGSDVTFLAPGSDFFQATTEKEQSKQ